MLSKNNSSVELKSPNYVPVIKDEAIYYGGSQMWFPSTSWKGKDYILNNYGCGTIATADLFLYLALKQNNFKTPDTEIAIRGGSEIHHENYDQYVRYINDHYTKTHRYIAVLGTKVASSVNAYSKAFGLGLDASWKFRLSYYDMLDIMEEMLSEDIPVILSIGPNTPKLWGKKGIPFYELRKIEFRVSDNKENENPASTDTKKQAETKKAYYYKVAYPIINSHFVTVTGIIKDDIASRFMLRISSWGKLYYINYEEYRDYIESTGGTFTSSIVQIRKTL
jgi:hypothetical protein